MDRTTARRQAEELVARMDLLEVASQLRFDAPAIPRLGVPAYNWWNEALHGVARAGTATSFPQAIGLAASFDPELVQRLGDIAATEGRAKYNTLSALGDRDIYKGLTFWSPNINIFRDPRWGRGHETYGEDPYLTSRLGVAYIRGLQGSGDYLKAAACAKHFAVHSGPESQRHSLNVEISRRDMEDTYLPAFQAAVQEGQVESVMGAYNAVNGAPACGSTELLRDILREEWGFQGHVVSDCGAVQDFHEHHHMTDSPAESTAMALKAGCDLNCGCTYRCLPTALAQRRITEQELRQAAVRLFTTRFALGILGQQTPYDTIGYDVIECPEHLAAARQAAEESMVLLKNDGILPLNSSALRTVAVVGPNANSRAALVGNYHGTSSRYITLLEGVQDALAGEPVRVLYAEGSHLFRDRVEGCSGPDDRISEAVAVTNMADVTLLVLGLDETLEGEEGDASNFDASGDKRDLLLPESQRRLAQAVLATGKPVALCLMAGSSIDISDLAEQARAVLLVWYPGARGGQTAADILFGRRSPSGKLPVTFYYNSALEEMPGFADYSMENRTYRYYRGRPLYPFGYGLTYGSHRLTDFRLRGRTALVTLETDRPSPEVVQIYALDTSDPTAVHPRLCGFRRISGETAGRQELEIPLDPRAFTVLEADGTRSPGCGPWKLWAGFGQPDDRTRELTGQESLTCTVCDI